MAAVALATAAVLATDGDFLHGLRAWSELENAVPESDAAIASGRSLYRAHCVGCHGELGRGDGPAGSALDPPPADLVLHVPQHSDGELYYFISRGIPGTAMPSWRSSLSSRERWHLVHYLRRLAAGSP
ncbi:MAG: c-type cytochrome [Candidatus Limnocylindria bacterium]